MSKIYTYFFYLIFLAGLFVFPQCQDKSVGSEWHGYQMKEFDFLNKTARIVVPKKSVDGNPWIWRARFWGHEPQVDVELLKLGFHLVYVDVADLFGSNDAVEIWSQFYTYVTKSYQLNPKVVLEGFSRGGLIVYNWAAKFPDKVACIYADNPVCDISSWPGGKGVGKGSEQAWKICMSAHQISESSYEAFKDHPVTTADLVAKAGVPSIHVLNTEDQVVPLAENSEIIERVYKKYNGPYTSIVKEGLDHHPHSLKDPTPIVRFILKHTQPELLNSIPKNKVQPSAVLRSDFNNSQQAFQSEQNSTVVFLGGSITYNGGWRDSVMQHIKNKYPSTTFNFINAGIPSMGSTPGSIRFSQDVLNEGKVDLLFVEAAVNDDTNGRDSLAQIRGMEGIIRQALLANPKMDILLMHFVDQGKMKAYNLNMTPLVIENHELVANYYQVPSLNLAKEVNDRILQHEFSWKEDFINLHPSPFGQGLYAASMIKTLDTLWKVNSSKRSFPEQPLNPYSYYNGKFLSTKQARTDGNWQRISSWKPPDDKPTRAGFVSRPVLEASQPGASVHMSFSGRAIGILVPAGPDSGIIKYKIDQQPYKTQDLFTRWSKHLHLPWIYMLEDELPDGEHELEIQIDPVRNTESVGNACRIFEFVVN